MFIFNVLPLREFCSPKSQFAMVNVCVLSMYYHVFAKFASIIDPFTLCFRLLPRQTTLGNFSKLRKFRAVRPHSPQTTRNSHQLLTYYTLCFRHLPRQTTLGNFSKLRKFHAVCPHSPRIPQNLHYSINLLYIMFQAPSPAENPAEFQRITQIPRSLPTQSANYAKFAHFANITRYISDA